jgi:hypothetical protein
MIVPPNDPSRGSQLNPADDEGVIWYKGMAQLAQSFADLWADLLEHEERLDALTLVSSGFRVGGPGAAACAGVAGTVLGLTMLPPTGALAAAGQSVALA